MIALGYLAVFGGALLVISGLTASSVASVVKGAPDHANATNPVEGVSGGTEAGSAPSSIAGVPGSAGLKALFPRGGYSLERTDAGVDFGLQSGKPLGAVGAGQIAAVQHYSGFGTTIFQKLDSPIGGFQYVYYALETGANTPAAVGARVQAGSPIATGTGGGMEIGLATGPSVTGINQQHIAAGDRTRIGELFARALGLSPGAPNTPAKVG